MKKVYLSMKLSSTRTLSMIRVDQSVVARIGNEETGTGISFGYGALTKLILNPNQAWSRTEGTGLYPYSGTGYNIHRKLRSTSILQISLEVQG